MNKFYSKALFFTLSIGLSPTGFSQSVAINNTGASAAAGAILDISSTSKGFLIPRLANQAAINAIVNPAVGLLVYDLSSNCVEFNYNGTATGWIIMACPCTTAPTATGAITAANPANTDVCLSMTNQTLTVPTVAGATSYNWTVPTEVGSWSGQGGTTITVGTYTATGSGTFSVTASNSCGISAPASTFTINVFNGNPTATGITLSPSVTNICGTATYTATITGLGNYDIINWTAPSTLCSAGNVTAANFGNGSTSLIISGGTGGSGVISVTVSNPCNTISATSATINCSAAAPAGTLTAASTNFCSASATDVITYSAADYNTIVWTAPVAICSPAVVTAANTANAATLTLSGGTGGSGVVTATLSNYCSPPSLVLTTPTITDYASAPTATSLTAATTTPCSPDLLTINGLSANYATITWAARATLCSPAVIAAANLANATTLTLSGGTGGTGTVTATITNTCGNIVETSASITYTIPTINIDGKVEMADPATTMAVPGTTANEIILISLLGGNSNAGTVVKVDGNNANFYTSVGGGNGIIFVYSYITTTVGPHNIVVTWGGMGATYSIAQATSFMGFCGAPTMAGNVKTANGTAKTNTSVNMTPGATNSYLFGDYCINTNSAAGTTSWTTVAQLVTYHSNAGGRQYDFSFGGVQDATVTPVTVKGDDTQMGAMNPDAGEILFNIYP